MVKEMPLEDATTCGKGDAITTWAEKAGFHTKAKVLLTCLQPLPDGCCPRNASSPSPTPARGNPEPSKVSETCGRRQR